MNIPNFHAKIYGHLTDLYAASSDSSDGKFSKFITFTRTCVPYYIHVYARSLRKVASFPSLLSLILKKVQGFVPRRHVK